MRFRRLGISSFCAVTFLSLTACQTFAPKNVRNTDGMLVTTHEAPVDLPPSTTTVIDSNKTTDERIVDFKDIPKQYQDLVMRWVGYFQGRGRPHMERYLSRSGRYVHFMKSILRKNEMPEDLVYIALIESGFNYKARSRANAVGYWQFIRATGRAYGMRINGLVDERRDPVRSTEAASQYLKSLYNLFGSWPLAIAAYNVGENRIKRVVMKKYTRDLWELISLKQLPKETSNYVPKYIAAEMIARDPARFGFTDIQYEPPISYDTLTAQSSVDLRKLARELGLDYENVSMLNPGYKTNIAPNYGDEVVVRVPKGSREKAVAVIENCYVSDKDVRVAARESDTQTRGSHRYYKVQRGDNLQSIARRFNTTTGELQRIAGLRRGSLIRAGSYLRLPDDGISSTSRNERQSRTVARSRPSKAAKNFNSAVHVVRRGDTLSSIARRYDIPIGQIVVANNLSKKAVINIGRKLVIPE